MWAVLPHTVGVLPHSVGEFHHTERGFPHSVTHARHTVEEFQFAHSVMTLTCHLCGLVPPTFLLVLTEGSGRAVL